MSWIYAADIGTRKIAGIVGRSGAGYVEAVALEMREHAERALWDGQVHDVPLVAKALKDITTALERRLGEPLKRVALAAAGRSLCTRTAKAALPLERHRLIDAATVQRLVHQAVNTVFRSMGEDFQCVGYTPVRFLLDGEEIMNLEGLTGKEACAEVLATFLPRVVLDGLLSSAEHAGLQVESVTLEPVAAMEAVLPRDLRILNLALVDIGAGTSDIALIRDRVVFSLDMVPVAGDEITEALCRAFLIDFQEGERVKRAFSDPAVSTVQVQDFFGRSREIHRLEAQEVFHEAVRGLCRAVADKILEKNGAPPDALLLVGGASATWGLVEGFQEALNLEKKRIGARQLASPRLKDATGMLQGGAWATPAGILLSAAFEKSLFVRRFFLNDQPKAVLYSKPPTVQEALEQLGLPLRALRPSLAKPRSFFLGGRLVQWKMQEPEDAVVSVDGEPVSFGSPLSQDARVRYQPPKEMLPLIPKVRDLPNLSEPLRLFLNGVPVSIKTQVFVNGRRAQDEEDIPEGAQVEIRMPQTYRELLETQGFDLSGGESRRILVSVNGEPFFLNQQNYRLMVNGRPASLEDALQNDVQVDFQLNVQNAYRVRDVVALPKDGRPLKVRVNGREILLPGEKGKIFMNGLPVDPDEFVIDHAVIVTRDGEDAKGLVSHVLAALEEKPHPKEGGQRLRIEINGKPAGFSTPIPSGADLILRFE